MQQLGPPAGTSSDIESPPSVDPRTPTLTDDQRLAVIEAGRHFADTGDWPIVGDVIRRLARRGLSTAIRSAVHSLPSNVGFESDQKLVLTAEGFALSGHGSEILEALVLFAGTAARIYLGEHEQPIIRSDDFTDLVPPGVADKVEFLIDGTEHFFLGSGGGSAQVGGGAKGEYIWWWEVTEHAIQFQNCHTIDRYLTLRRELLPPKNSVVATMAYPTTASIDVNTTEATTSAGAGPKNVQSAQPKELHDERSTDHAEPWPSLAPMIHGA